MSGSGPAVECVPGVERRLRLRLRLQGVVQGVGFRPHVYRLATEMRLCGWVGNTSAGAVMEVEGGEAQLLKFRRRLGMERPPGCSIQSLETVWLEPLGLRDFQIRPSETGGFRTALVRPDVATCPSCVREIFDPRDRRHRYPFTNCTHCGPRYSIIASLPYDRLNTSMRDFAMCADCRAEYENPADRRFHAQPNACPRCGPQLELWSEQGAVVGQADRALQLAADAVRRGQILAVKGLGGFHLVTDARGGDAVRRLRLRKHREEKPLAIMVPGMGEARALCAISELEEELLCSPEAPIVLLRRLDVSGATLEIAPEVSPDNPWLGIMLPYTPLHHLLMAELGFPVVATSGNLSDEPICIDEREARVRLAGIADAFLVHNRPILRHVDDSVVRVVAGREMLIRRARGYAPLPVAQGMGLSASEGATAVSAGAQLCGESSVMAMGGQQKNCVALSCGNLILLSQHIGDLDTPAALGAFRQVTADLEQLFNVSPGCIVSDLHPDYQSTREAKNRQGRQVGVQHHYAHILSCMADNEVEGPVLGVAWDGTGYGLDRTIWGGEFLIASRGGFERFATLRSFRLPGGECAVREPRRSAMGLLFEQGGEAAFELAVPAVAAFSAAELAAVRLALSRNVNAPRTTAVGRLFDAVASLVGIRQRVSFEGQAAMALEWLVQDRPMSGSYAFQLRLAEVAPGGIRDVARDARWIADWAPMLEGIVHDLGCGVGPAAMAGRFHAGLIELIAEVASRAEQERVVLSGGCFQNLVLLEGVIARLGRAGHRVYWHQRVPTNDGGLALGQAAAVL